MSCHQEFLTRALEGTLLVEPGIVKCCEAVLKVASEFCMDAQVLKPPPEAENSSRSSRGSSTGGAAPRGGTQRGPDGYHSRLYGVIVLSHLPFQ